VPPCGTLSGTRGVAFSPVGTQPATGDFIWVQLLAPTNGSSFTNEISCVQASGPTTTNITYSGGFDGSVFPSPTNDSPFTPLPTDDISVTRAFAATMYLLWQPDPTDYPNSIPVPLAYQQWVFNGSATRATTSDSWTASGYGGPYSGGSVLSTASQSNMGYPSWSAQNSRSSDSCP
jgi:hypothetical protein